MSTFYELPEYGAILTLLDAVLAQINIGLLIYHRQDEDDPTRLKLIYANAEASRCTGVDLTQKVGLTILEAFPALTGTSLPQTYLEVSKTNQAQRLGTVEYADSQLARRRYDVKAFPMPYRSVGVLFECVSGPAR